MTYDHSVELTRKDGSARRFRIYGRPAPNKGEIITLPIEGHLVTAKSVQRMGKIPLNRKWVNQLTI